MKTIEIFFRNFLLKLLTFAASFREKTEFPGTGCGKQFSKILFIRLNRIGDALVVTPLLHQIKKELNSKIYVIADRNNHFVFTNNVDVDEILIFKKGIKGIKEILNFIKNDNIQTIVDLHDDVSTTVSFLIALSDAKNKFAIEKENKNIYTQTVKRLDPKTTHVVDRIMEISKLFGIKENTEEARIICNTSKQSEVKAKLFLQKHFRKNRFLIGINISAGSQARFWGIENFKLVLKFLSDYDLDVLLLCSPEDKNAAEQISGKNVIFSSESFDEFASMIGKLSLLFTPDTMAVHLAAAFNVAVFGVYVHYNIEDMIWTPYGSEFDCVITKENTLKNVTFEEVKNRLKPFLERLLNGLTLK